MLELAPLLPPLMLNITKGGSHVPQCSVARSAWTLFTRLTQLSKSQKSVGKPRRIHKKEEEERKISPWCCCCLVWTWTRWVSFNHPKFPVLDPSSKRRWTRKKKESTRRRQLFLSFSLPLSPSSLMIELTQRQMTRLSSSSDMATGNLRLGFPWCQSFGFIWKGQKRTWRRHFSPSTLITHPPPPYVLYSSKNKQ